MGFLGSSREDFVNRRRSPARDQLLLVKARVDVAHQEKMRRAGALAVVAVALAGLVWAGAMGSSALAAALFQKNGRFEIRHLALHSSGRLTPEHLRHYASLSEGLNLFSVDLAEVRRKLEEVPLIGRAEIQRRLPDTLVVNVTERVALARVQQLGQPALPVDREGHLMSPPASPVLPLVTGIAERGLAPGGVIRQPGARDALLLLDLHDNARLAGTVQIASVDASDPTQLILTLQTGGKVLMARDQLERRLGVLAAMIREGDRSGRGDLIWADLTVDRNEPARFRLDSEPAAPAAPQHPAVPPARTRARSNHG